MDVRSLICVDEARVYLPLRSPQEVQIIFTYNSLSYQLFLRKLLIALISWSRFQDTSSTAASSVLPHDVHCNFGRITELWEPVSWVFNASSFYFYSLDSNKEQLERICTVVWIFSNMKIVPQVFLGVCRSGHSCWAAVKYPPEPLIFTHWGNFFPPIAQIIHFLEQKHSAFWEHICHLMAGAPWELRWAISNDNSFPFPYLRLQSHFTMFCSGKGIQKCDGSFTPWGVIESFCGASPPKRGKDGKHYQSQVWDPSSRG